MGPGDVDKLLKKETRPPFVPKLKDPCDTSNFDEYPSDAGSLSRRVKSTIGSSIGSTMRLGRRSLESRWISANREGVYRENDLFS